MQLHKIIAIITIVNILRKIECCDPDCSPTACNPLSGVCTNCINNKVLDFSILKCIQSDGAICGTIIQQCLYCQGSLKATMTNCTKCIATYILNITANKCVPGNTCSLFLSNCQECEGIFSNQYSEQPALNCLLCKPQFIKVQDPITNLGKCELDCSQLHSNCVKCKLVTSTTNLCLKCKSGMVAVALTHCKIPSLTECDNISKGCKTCEGALEKTPLFTCLSCDNTQKYVLSATNGLCKLDCQQAVSDPSCVECYFDTVWKCQKCTNGQVLNTTLASQINCRPSVEIDCKSIPNCISCEGGDPQQNTVSIICLLCTNQLIVNNNGTTCVKATSSECLKVTSHCISCEGSLKSATKLNCLQCDQGFKLMTSQQISGVQYILGQTYCELNCQNLTNYCIECVENILGTLCLRCKNYTVLSDDQRNCRVPLPEECGSRIQFCISCEGSFFPLGIIICRQCQAGYILVTDAVTNTQHCQLDCSKILDCATCGGSPETKIVCTTCYNSKVPTQNDGGLSCRLSVPDDCTSISNCQRCQGSLTQLTLLKCLECLPTYCLLLINGNKTCMPTPAILSNCAICQTNTACAFCVNNYIVNPLDAKCTPTAAQTSLCSSIQNCVLCEGSKDVLICKSCIQPTHSVANNGGNCKCSITNCLSCTTQLGNQICLLCGNGKFVSQDQKSCNDVMSKADCQMNITDCYVCQGATTMISCIACLNDLVPNQAQKKCVECSTHIKDCTKCKVDELGHSICLACGNGKLPSTTNYSLSCEANNTYCAEKIHECYICEGSIDQVIKNNFFSFHFFFLNYTS